MRDEQGRPLTETDMADLVTFMETDVCSCFLGSTYAVVQKNLSNTSANMSTKEMTEQLQQFTLRVNLEMKLPSMKT